MPVTLRSQSCTRGVLPADFERHDAVVIGFEWRFSEWWPTTLREIVKAIHKHVQVIILVPDISSEDVLIESLEQVGVLPACVHFVRLQTNSIWVRDFAPSTVRLLTGQWKWIDSYYWAGGNRLHDDRLPSALASAFGMSEVYAPICLENGNLLTNGKDLVISTTQLLKKNMRCGYDEQHVTKTIQHLFGATTVIYLEPLEGEPLGHADWFAAFTAPDTIVVGDYRGVDPVNAEILDRNARRLASFVTESGPLNVVRLQMPPRGRDFFGGSYTNVLFANGVLLVPSWPNADPIIEERVLATYRGLLPQWEVVAIDAGWLGRQDGALRCATKQLHGASLPAAGAAPGAISGSAALA